MKSRAQPKSLRRRARALNRRLADEYGQPEKPQLDPLDELMVTILSQNTSDTNRDLAYERLRERFPDWESVRTAAREEIEDAIKPAGLWKQKARTIQEALEAIHEQEGSLDLSILEELDDEEVLDYLTGLRGVGVKTAACVLCFSLRRPFIPVDTHVHRLSGRLGLIPEKASANDAHDLLNDDSAVPAELRFEFHINLIRHGREVCKARRPKCDSCVLEDLCPKVGLDGG